MKWLEILLVILSVVLMIAYFAAIVVLLANIIYWPIWWLFELYGGIV